jgi:hypothetical protein
MGYDVVRIFLEIIIIIYKGHAKAHVGFAIAMWVPSMAP